MGADQRLFVAITALLLVAPMLALLQMSHGPPSWFVVVAVAAVVGAVVIAAGQLLLVLSVIPLQAPRSSPEESV